MKLEDRAPKVEEVQVVPETPALQVIDLQPFTFDIAAAAQTAGPEETSAALEQVQSGATSPGALFAWIDDLLAPEQPASDVDPADQQEGVIPDFMKDTLLVSGAAGTPPPSAEIEAPPYSDDDYLFSAVRRRRLDDEWPGPAQDPDPTTTADEGKARSGT